MLPGKLAWILQESPAFIVPLILLATTSSACWQSPVNKILVICFGLHYVQRYEIIRCFISSPLVNDDVSVQEHYISFNHSWLKTFTIRSLYLCCDILHIQWFHAMPLFAQPQLL